MLTVKVMYIDGGEEIRSGMSIGFNPAQQSISVSGIEHNIFLKQGEIAYVMNDSGKTISKYEGKVSAEQLRQSAKEMVERSILSSPAIRAARSRNV